MKEGSEPIESQVTALRVPRIVNLLVLLAYLNNVLPLCARMLVRNAN